MHCLVLGGAGFIGSHIVDALVDKGHQVRVFDMSNIDMRNLTLHGNSIEIIGGDFENSDDIERALEDIDIVVHLICTTLPSSSNENPAYDVQSNVVSTLRLLDSAVKNGVKKIVYASSGGTVYGVPNKTPIPESHPTNPHCSYGITKLTVERYLELYHHLHGLEYVILRAANPYGERQRTNNVQGAVAVFLGKTLRDEVITIWGDGSVARDYFHVSDLTAAFVQVIENDTPSRIYNIGSGSPHSLKDILEVTEHITGKRPRVEFSAARPLDVPINFLDISRARAEINWSPKIELKEGVTRFWEWIKNSKEWPD